MSATTGVQSSPPTVQVVTLQDSGKDGSQSVDECGDHVGLTSNEAYGLVTISVQDTAYRLHDILWNWVTGGGPQFAVETFNLTHKGPGCP